MKSLRKYCYLVGLLLAVAVLLATLELLAPEVAVAPEETVSSTTEEAERQKTAITETSINQALKTVDSVSENSIGLLHSQASFNLNQSLSLGWNFSGLPESSGLVLNLVRDVPAADRFKYNGATGPVTLQPIEVGNGKGSITWQLNQVGCAPSDAPTWCDVQPGRYYVEGVVYDQADFPILGMFRPSNPAPKVLATYQTKTFEIRGDADLSVLERELLGAAINEFVEAFSLDQGGGIFTAKNFVKIDETWFEEKGLKCLNFSLSAPFDGKMKACGHPLKRDAVTLRATDTLSINPAIQDYETAKALAQEQATQPYWSRVAFRTQPSPAEAGFPGEAIIDFYEWSNQNPEATTYLSYSLRNWDLKENNWLFLYSVNKAGGSESGSDRFNDSVWVKVLPSGLACRVAMGPQNQIRFDPERDALECL